MPATSDAPHLAPHVGQILAQLRGRIRRYIVLRGVSLLVAFLAASFWVALGVDYWLDHAFDSPRALRVGLLVAVGFGAVYVLWKWLLSPLLVRLTDRNMAVLLERRYEQLRESLLTAVELDPRAGEMGDLGREMLAHTYDVASRETDGLHLTQVFNRAPLRKALAAASILTGTIIALAVLFPETFHTGVARVLAASDTPWPRSTFLSIEGFEQGEAVVAKGGDLRVVVNAALSGVVPAAIEIRYRSAEGQRDRKTMVREGNARPDVDEFQPFAYQFQGILSPLEFDVRGGDARLRGLRIRVVDSPTITSVLHCEYPSYLGQAPRDIPVSGSVPLPRGTKVAVVATANKSLMRAVVDYQDPDGANRTATLTPEGDAGRQFQFTIDRLDNDVNLQFTLHDTDRIVNRDPIRVSLVALPDTAPQVNVRLVGIGSAVTPQARIPLAGELIDDYGINRAWIETAVDQGEPRQTPFAAKFDRATNATVSEALEAADLKIQPGQKLQLAVRAEDAHTHPDDPLPNIGQGDRFVLDVVTPEALRALLEARELNLRQRFETIIQEVTEQRESITNLDQTPVDDTDGAKEPPETLREKAKERARLKVERARQNSPKNAEETEGVALAFEEIRAELVNNRIDTEELKIRLQGQIADPLHAIARQRFPELDKRLATLAPLLEMPPNSGDDPARGEARSAVLAQYDLILVEMQQVKEKMLELETFNEALELLRGIIADQQRISEETKKQNKGSVLKDL